MRLLIAGLGVTIFALLCLLAFVVFQPELVVCRLPICRASDLERVLSEHQEASAARLERAIRDLGGRWVTIEPDSALLAARRRVQVVFFEAREEIVGPCSPTTVSAVLEFDGLGSLERYEVEESASCL